MWKGGGGGVEWGTGVGKRKQNSVEKQSIGETKAITRCITRTSAFASPGGRRILKRFV